MVFTDGIHITAQSLPELCAYGQKIGLDCFWLQSGRRNLHPHFVICGKVKERVLADVSVKKVSTREFVDICKRYFTTTNGNNETDTPTAALPSETDFDRMISNIFSKAGIDRNK
jgi:hypothetical protein